MKKSFFISFLKSLTALKCWSCDSKSHLECFIYGREKTCSGRDDVCFYEQRERRGKLVSVRQGCQQDRACQSQWRQNGRQNRHQRFNSCRPESFLRWPSSVCYQCCYEDLCGYLWTPADRSEWTTDARKVSKMSYSFVIGGYDY